MSDDDRFKQQPIRVGHIAIHEDGSMTAVFDDGSSLPRTEPDPVTARVVYGDWMPEIRAAMGKARELDDHVPFTWEDVTVRVHPGDEAFDVRARWRAAKFERPGTWFSADDIASRWSGLTPTRLGQVARLLGLCGSEKHVRAIDGRNEYSPAAVGLIERELRSRGCTRAEADDD